MKLVIDANILFSALIKKGFTYELLFDSTFELYAPEFLIEEFQKYEDLIIKKGNLSKEQFVQMIHLLKDIIITVPMKKHNFNLAKKISPDENDFMYFALALKLNCPIWTNDKKLKEQDKVIVWNTKELIDKDFL